MKKVKNKIEQGETSITKNGETVIMFQKEITDVITLSCSSSTTSDWSGCDGLGTSRGSWTKPEVLALNCSYLMIVKITSFTETCKDNKYYKYSITA